jgi:hypothetical protein
LEQSLPIGISENKVAVSSSQIIFIAVFSFFLSFFLLAGAQVFCCGFHQPSAHTVQIFCWAKTKPTGVF